MPNRILKDSICTSPNIDQLSRNAEVFFYRLIVQCDDFGRMDARRAILRAKCYPLQIERVSESDITLWLLELEHAKLVTIYTVDDQDYLQMRTWDKHQQVRAKRSKYPSLPDDDISSYHLISNDSKCTRNPIQSESNPNPSGTPPPPDFQTTMTMQYEAVLGMVPTASYHEMLDYMRKLDARKANEWWGLALKETTQAKRPGWQYMKAVLESWLAAGHLTGNRNGSDPQKAAVKTIEDPITGKRIEIGLTS